LVTG
jgi:hypothetical protein